LVTAMEKENLSDMTTAQVAALGYPTVYADASVEIAHAITDISNQMKAEFGDSASFGTKKTAGYSAQLDSEIEGILARTGEQFRHIYAVSQGPRWAVFQEQQYGLDDPEVAKEWTETYQILTEMTDQMAVAEKTDTQTKAQVKDEVHKAAMDRIQQLKDQNEKFAGQIDELNKETLKPTSQQLRAWQGDYTYAGAYTGGSGYGRKGRKGLRKKAGKKPKSRRKFRGGRRKSGRGSGKKTKIKYGSGKFSVSTPRSSKLRKRKVR